MHKRTLLIVDDIKSNREILKNMLAGDYITLEAADGREAISVMTGEYRSISAVLLDLGMPLMDGFEVLSYMQRNEKLSQLPVIVTTGQTDSGSEERALFLGAKDYISKPYKSAIIKQRILNTIVLRETAATVNALQRDRLTGLLSRDAFFDRVGELVADKQPEFYLMTCFDIEKFKVINDQYGTDKGDEVLKHVANVFQREFEPHGCLCSRIRDDNFAILYPTSLFNSEQLYEIRRKACDVPGLLAPISYSIGRYLITDTEMSPSAMFDRAVLAVSTIKGRYDIKSVDYDESMRDRLLNEQEIVTDMESALKAGQFEVWYQPQYNHSTGALIGSEALARWRHPEKGLVPPGAFIPVFEKNGFIYELDKYVWRSVCKYLRQQIDIGCTPLPVSVNISRYDIYRQDLIDYLTGLISEFKLPVDLLRLEVTESAFSVSTAHIVTVVKNLTDLGFTLEIDDFGSGYSSLNTLKNVPAQVVKLDMRFLEDDGGSGRGGSIIESIVRMAKWLGMSVIAEGVEEKTQADFLKSIGCNYIQGYLYAKPMPESEYTKLCADSNKENKLFSLETLENLDNKSFWNPKSLDTLIFNSYIGAACIFEYSHGKIELIRATDKFAQIIGNAGMTVEDVLKINWSECIDDKDREKLTGDIEKSRESKKEITGEYIFTGLPGCPYETYLRSTMRVIATTAERCIVYCLNENITAQRKAERREREVSEQLQVVLDYVACGITAVAFNENQVEYLLTNDGYYRIFGYTPEQYNQEIGANPYKMLVDADKDMVSGVVTQVMNTRKPTTIEYRALRRDGAVIWLRSNISMALYEGITKPVQICTYVDITKQKHDEIALRDTTEQIKMMMDDIPGGFARMLVLEDGSMKTIFINDGLSRLTGMTHDELIAMYSNDAMAGVHPDDVSIVKEAVSCMLTNGEAHSSRYRLCSATDYIWLSVFGRCTHDAAGLTYLNIYYSNAEEQVKDEKRRKEILDNLSCGVALYEYDGKQLSISHINKRYWELVNRPSKEYTGSSFAQVLYPGDRETVFTELLLAIKENRDISCDVRILYGESEYRPFHVSGRILDKKDGTYSVYTIYTPISNEAMSIQEMLPIALGAVMNSQTEYTFVKDKNLRYVCCSREVVRLTKMKREADVIGKSDRELFDTELAERFYKDDSKILQTGESMPDTIDRLPPLDGVERYACTSKFPLKDSDGNVVGVYGIGRDITEARKLRSRFDLLANSIPGGIAAYEYSGGKLTVTFFNDGFCNLFGLSRQECDAIGKQNPLAGIFKEDLPELNRQLNALASDCTQIDCVFRVHLKDGDFKWINLKAMVCEKTDNGIAFNAVLLDITERQKAVEKMRISEEENRLAVRHTKNTVCRYDIQSKILHVPERVCDDYLLSTETPDVPDEQIREGLISAETADAYAKFYIDIKNGSKTGKTVFQRNSKRGWRWIEGYYSTIFSQDGKPVSAVISFADVTDEMERETAYKRWKQSFVKKAPESFTLLRYNFKTGICVKETEGSLLTFDYKSERFDFKIFTTRYVSRFVEEEDKNGFLTFINTDRLLSEYYQGKSVVSLDYREKQNSGYRWVRLTVDMVELSASSDIEAVLLFEDINDAKRRELTTQKKAKNDPLTGVLNRTAFKEAVDDIITSSPDTQHALLMLDLDGFKMVNDAFGHETGDKSLVDIADSLRSVLHSGDIAGRLGGDEFLIFINNNANDLSVAERAKQICAIMRKSYSAEVEVSCSIGIAMTPRDGDSFDALYRKADAALYYVKGSGRNNYALYRDDMADEHLIQRDPVSEGETQRHKKRRMLIVDDSRIDHAMLTAIFSSDFIVEKARDGATALIRLRHYGSAISVVLLDLVMPGMDGFEVLKKMRASADLQNIPVIVVSGDDNQETVLHAIKAGAVDFVNKPVDPELLRIRVQSAISKSENEQLRAKNSLLEYQNEEVTRYKTALEASGAVVVENDWLSGTFTYDPIMSEYIAGNYDSRGFWHILLSDFIADTQTVHEMQLLVQSVAIKREITKERTIVRLKTPRKDSHWFRMNVLKTTNEYGLTNKIYMVFIDLDIGKHETATNT